MKKAFVFSLIALFIISANTNLSAQTRNIILIDKIKGLTPKYIYCAAESELDYYLMLGEAGGKKLRTSSAFIENLKIQIKRNKSKPFKAIKYKKQLKIIRSILKPKLSQCRSEIKKAAIKPSPTPQPQPSVRIPTATPLPKFTATINPAICGNAIVEAGEECDDGDTSNQNTCLNNCNKSYCGDGYLQDQERCIADDPIASVYVEIKKQLSSRFCQSSLSDYTLISKQADLMNAINFMLSSYLKDLPREQLISSLVGLKKDSDNLLTNCIVSNYKPLSTSQLRNLINLPTANTQTSLIAQNLQHQLVKSSCQNYPALNDHQFNYINYFGDFDIEVYKWYLDFIDHCEDFKAGRIYDLSLDNAYSEGLNFQITYSTCESTQAFAPSSNLTDDKLILSLIYPNLHLTCLEPKISSKPVYVHTGTKSISSLAVKFGEFEKEFKNIIQKSKVTNLVPKKDFIDQLPKIKASILPGMYDGFYSYPRDNNNRDLPFKVIGLTNIAETLWGQLRQVAPPSQTTALIKIFKNYNYDPAGKSTWGEHPLIQNLDFSGVAWENNKSGTLISRQHILVAAHFRRDVGDTVMFHDRNGNPVVRRVVAIKSLERDICIAKLDSPVPVGVTHYKLLYNDIDIVGAPVIVTDRFLQAGIMQVSNVWQNHNINDDGSIYGTHDRIITFIKPSNEYKDVNRGLTSGDSGHPTFIVLNGELVLVETHTTPGAGPNYSSFWNQEMIRKAISDLG